MDLRLRNTLDYAKSELEEIMEFMDEGKLTEKGAFIRMFCLGKVLVGWDDEQPEYEQVTHLMKTNEYVNSILDEISRKRAS